MPIDAAWRVLKQHDLSEVYSFLNQLTPDDVGVERVGDYTVHFEGFTDMCNMSITPDCPAEQLHQEVWNDFDTRQGQEPIERNKTGVSEENPIIFSIYHTPEVNN